MSAPVSAPASSAEHRDQHAGARAALALGALGVVFGDIGTSPLYTVQTVFNPAIRTGRRSRPTASSGSSR